MTEGWRPIPGWEGFYEASTLGRIRSVDRVLATKAGPKRYRGQLLAQQVERVKGSYVRYTVALSRPGVKARMHRVYNLVALTFLGPRPEGLEVCHLNGDASDNRPDNLHYGTHRQNVDDALAHGTLRGKHGSNPLPAQCPKGHDYDKQTTPRHCRECAKGKYRRYRARKKEARR